LHLEKENDTISWFFGLSESQQNAIKGDEMAQLTLPLIPPGVTTITGAVSVFRDDHRWTYFLGYTPVYYHRANDQVMFRLVTSQMIDAGLCRHVDIITTFGVSKSSVNRWLKTLREGGPEAFFQKRRGRRGGTVLTPETLQEARRLLNTGHTRRETAELLDVRLDTLRKAIHDGRLDEPPPADLLPVVVTDTSTRNERAAAAADGMGTACIRTDDRTLAAFGKIDGATTRFEPCHDVPNGGVLCALPALLCNGLLEGSKTLLGKLKGYYTDLHVLLLLGFMALCRVKNVEQLRGQPPGEFGILLGLDRIPEARCLREKLDRLCGSDGAEKWAAHLSRYWMEGDPDRVGTLYIDGHVQVYNGHLTQLPRRYVTRQRLCLRGTTNYWVNDGIGQPFFAIEKPVDPGLLNTLTTDIVPRLLNDVPDQPDEEVLTANPFRHRFILVFDREGYSPAFFKAMWENHRIACITYHKYPEDPWPEAEFKEYTAVMPSGEPVRMRLAERGTLIGTGKNRIWVREVRKLTDSGHQTSILSTAYELPLTDLAVRMFSRWCQENFFRYMIQHFEIDMINEYGTESLPDTERVVNPTWRDLDRARNSVQNKLRYRRARFAELTMHSESEADPDKFQKWTLKKGQLLEEIEDLEHSLAQIKASLKATPKHITWGELSDEDKFRRLLPGRKRLADTVRMVAYRAETAMAGMLAGPTLNTSAARRLLQDLFVATADILPDPENGILRIRVHSASRPSANRSLSALFEKLNETETLYPGTQLKLIYELIGDPWIP